MTALSHPKEECSTAALGSMTDSTLFKFPHIMKEKYIRSEYACKEPLASVKRYHRNQRSSLEVYKQMSTEGQSQGRTQMEDCKKETRG